jgi:hypothetical protein
MHLKKANGFTLTWIDKVKALGIGLAFERSGWSHQSDCLVLSSSSIAGTHADNEALLFPLFLSAACSDKQACFHPSARRVATLPVDPISRLRQASSAFLTTPSFPAIAPRLTIFLGKKARAEKRLSRPQTSKQIETLAAITDKRRFVPAM